MAFKTVQLPSGRWGIFSGKRLLATIGSQQALNMIVYKLTDRQIPVQTADPVVAPTLV